eukprot:2803661-Prymnesium_polylepis.1
MLASVILSAIGLIVGEFSVSADNDGWSSRGTTIANREVQFDRLRSCYDLGSSQCWARAPDPEYRRALVENGDRRLSEQAPPSAPPAPPLPARCYSFSWRSSDLMVIYRSREAGSSLTQPHLLQQVCELEQQLLSNFGMDTRNCRTPRGVCTAATGAPT